MSAAGAEVVVVDLDNTLIRLEVDWAGLRRRLAELARAAGVEVAEPGIRALMDGARLPGMETLRAEMEQVLADAELAGAAGVEVTEPGIRALMDGARLPGMETLRAEMEQVLADAELAGARGPRNEALVEWLDRHADGVPVSVLSLNGRTAVLRALEANGLAARIAHVVGRADVRRGKPDPEGMLALAERHGVDTGRMLLVGDAETDRLCAERAGAAFLHVEAVGIDWRHGSRGP